MKLDKTQALFLTKVLFHYEQECKLTESVCERVKNIRNEMNQFILDENLDDELDETIKDEPIISGGDDVITIDDLCSLLPITTQEKTVIEFFGGSKQNTAELIIVPSSKYKGMLFIEKIIDEISIVERYPSAIAIYSSKNLSWEYFYVSKFPKQWTQMLKCYKRYNVRS